MSVLPDRSNVIEARSHVAFTVRRLRDAIGTEGIERLNPRILSGEGPDAEANFAFESGALAALDWILGNPLGRCFQDHLDALSEIEEEARHGRQRRATPHG